MRSIAFLGQVIRISEPCVVDSRKVPWRSGPHRSLVQRLIAFDSDYSMFMLGFSTLAAPLTTRCSAKARFAWNNAEGASTR